MPRAPVELLKGAVINIYSKDPVNQ